MRILPWASLYRGLWGLFARDPVSGENAPAGPMYNRDGSPRSSWYDPLGFAGLDKTPPPPLALQLLEENCGEIRSRQEELKTLIPKKANELQVLGMKLKGLEDHPHLAKIYALLQKRINTVGEELKKPSPGKNGKWRPAAGDDPEAGAGEIWSWRIIPTPISKKWQFRSKRWKCVTLARQKPGQPSA